MSSFDYIKGMTWGWVGRHGTWATPTASHSMAEMTKLGINWTAIAFQGLQDHPHATEIRFNEGTMVRDDEVVWAIREAQGHGLNVCLKPVVNCSDGTWRAYIDFPDASAPGEPSWAEWFSSYERFILHYAQIAQDTGCDMFCVGCEMVSSDRREAEWRALIEKVRTVYHGPITYNCNHHQEEKVRWWDAVDLISTSAYYPVTEWAERVPFLREWAARVQKPIFFMEVGCPSRAGSAMVPYDWTHEGVVDLAEQARFYEVMFDAMKDEAWFYGFMLWDWPAVLYPRDKAGENDDYCMYGKPAEAVVRTFYASR
nr:1,4-beta-xylanase [Alicyclobacillus acidiphilus]